MATTHNDTASGHVVLYSLQSVIKWVFDFLHRLYIRFICFRVGQCLEDVAQHTRAGHAESCAKTLKKIRVLWVESMVDMVVAKGGVITVLNATKMYVEHAEVPCLCIELLDQLVSKQEAASQLVENKGLDLLLSIMSAHDKDTKLRLLVCNILMNVSQWQELVPAILSSGAIPLVLDAMAKYPDELDLQERGCVLFFAASQIGDGPFLINRAGIDVILAAMRTFKTSRRIQDTGCFCMVFLIPNLRLARHMVAKGGIEAALQSIELFQTNESVCQGACNVLSLLLTKLEEDRDDLLASRIDTQRCLNAILRAMQAHKMTLPLQISCTHVLTDMLHHENAPKEMFCNLTIKNLLESARNHMLYSTIQENVWHPILIISHVIAKLSARILCEVFGTNEVDLFVEILSLHPKNSEIQTSIFKLIYLFMHEEALRDCIVQRDDVIKKVLDAGGKLPELGGILMSVIHRASWKNIQICEKLGKCGAIEVLYKVRRNCTFDGDEERVFEVVIRNLRQGGRENQEKIEQCERRRIEKKHFVVCCVCGKSACEVGRELLMKCAACTLAPYYCSEECQRAHWAAHKKVCKANKAK